MLRIPTETIDPTDEQRLKDYFFEKIRELNTQRSFGSYMYLYKQKYLLEIEWNKNWTYHIIGLDGIINVIDQPKTSMSVQYRCDRCKYELNITLEEDIDHNIFISSPDNRGYICPLCRDGGMTRTEK